jgi:hypothetical protein
MRRGTNAYRAAAPEPDDLWRLAEDPGASPQLRVAAAVALSPLLDEAGRHRLRVAANASATRSTRVALHRIASEPLAEKELLPLLDEDDSERPSLRAKE